MPAATARQAPAHVAAALFDAFAVPVAGAYNAKSKTAQHRDKYIPPVLLYKIDCGRGSLVHFVHHHAYFVQSGGVVTVHDARFFDFGPAV